jgi:putative transposase
MIDFARTAFGVSIRRGCHAIPACRGTYPITTALADPSRLPSDDASARSPRHGCVTAVGGLLRREGWQVNVKRVHRLYQLEGLDSEIIGRPVRARTCNQIVRRISSPEKSDKS